VVRTPETGVLIERKSCVCQDRLDRRAGAAYHAGVVGRRLPADSLLLALVGQLPPALEGRLPSRWQHHVPDERTS
jgi:hypothetical protein